MNTTENNKLIAEFMGMQLGHPDKNKTRWKNDWFEKLIVDGNEFESGARHTHLQFHSSWSWLMPVVQKIKDTPTYGSTDGIDFVLTCDLTKEKLLNISLYSDINEVYNAVVEFIKYYNEEKN